MAFCGAGSSNSIRVVRGNAGQGSGIGPELGAVAVAAGECAAENRVGHSKKRPRLSSQKSQCKVRLHREASRDLADVVDV